MLSNFYLIRLICILTYFYHKLILINELTYSLWMTNSHVLFRFVVFHRHSNVESISKLLKTNKVKQITQMAHSHSLLFDGSSGKWRMENHHVFSSSFSSSSCAAACCFFNNIFFFYWLEESSEMTARCECIWIRMTMINVSIAMEWSSRLSRQFVLMKWAEERRR